VAGQELNYLLRLAAIDPAGLTDQEKISRDLLLRQLAKTQEAAHFKEVGVAHPARWTASTPPTATGGRAELHFRQGLRTTGSPACTPSPRPSTKPPPICPSAWTTIASRPNISLSRRWSRSRTWPPRSPRTRPSPCRSKSFPASIKPAEQERIKAELLDAIAKEVQPAYLRFARFLEVSYIPAGRELPGISALPDGAKYYEF